MRVWVEYPYDVGYPHKLRAAEGPDTDAVISGDAAVELVVQGVATRAPGREPPPDLCIASKLSRKARRMLGINTLSLFP